MASRTVVCFALISALCLGLARAEEPSSPRPVRLGAVAYAPSAVTVFQDLKRYLNDHDYPADYVLYSNYDALVTALDQGEVDITWNTPLAHAQYHVRNACQSQTLVMRDVDQNVKSVLIVRADSDIDSPTDLAGKRLVLGSADAAEATVLPLHFLKEQDIDLGKVEMVSLDREVDFKGNPCCSPEFVLKAVREGRGDAGIVTEDLWNSISAEEKERDTLKAVWTSPPFSHCVFTASRDFDPALAKRFQELMTEMDVNDSDATRLMQLEGTQKWLSGSPDGFAELVEALQSTK